MKITRITRIIKIITIIGLLALILLISSLFITTLNIKAEPLPSTTEFSAYEATFNRGDSKIKKVIVLQDNKYQKEYILVPGYGIQYRVEN